MTKLSPLQLLEYEKHAAMFWLDQLVGCQSLSIEATVAHIHTMLEVCKNLEEPPEGYTPAEWDFELTLRYPFIEVIGLQIIEKLARLPPTGQ